jgi:hypothetical protein
VVCIVSFAYAEENWEKRIPVEVSNPHDVLLKDVPVIINIADLRVDPAKMTPGHLTVADPADKAVTPLVQLDDVDGDNVLDELVFLTTLAPKETKSFYVYVSKSGQDWLQQERYTYALSAGATFAWESEVAGYRTYGPFIFDTFGKNKENPTLILLRCYDAQGRQVYHHHVQSFRGMDTLKVGTTSGLGGVVMKTPSGKMQPSQAAIKGTVIASGPARSIIKLEQEPFSNETGKFQVTRTATIYAHHFETTVDETVSILEVTGEGQYGIGIRKDKIMEFVPSVEDGVFLQWHNQGDDMGDCGIGLLLPPEKIAEVSDDDADDHMILFKDTLEAGKKIEYRFIAVSAWKRGGYIGSLEEFKGLAKSVANLQLPINISLGADELPPQ